MDKKTKEKAKSAAEKAKSAAKKAMSEIREGYNDKKGSESPESEMAATESPKLVY